MALMNRNYVTFVNVIETADGHTYDYHKVMATYYNNVNTTNINSEITPQGDINVYFKDNNYVACGSCKGKLAKNQWTLNEGDYLIIGDSKDMNKAKLITQITDYRNIPSKLSHVEVIAR